VNGGGRPEGTTGPVLSPIAASQGTATPPGVSGSGFTLTTGKPISILEIAHPERN
jgi:hypothetical protein